MFSDRTDWKLALNRFTQAQREAALAGAELLDLTVSNPTRAELYYDTDLILGSLASPRSMDYDPQPKGLLSARQAVASYYREEHELYQLDPEDVILTTSTSEGYSYVFRLLCNPGDELLVPKPSYPLFDFLAELQDVKLAPYPLIYDHGWQVDFPSLYKAVNHRTRGVVVVHPNNPTGSYAGESERASLNAFCSEYNLSLIVDEVFLDYSLDGTRRPTFAGSEETLTFTLSGLSKISCLPQMKLSWIVAGGIRKQDALDRLEVIADTYLSVNAPIQWAAPTLLGQRKQVQSLLLDRARMNLEELDRQLSKQKPCTRLDVEGGWYAVLRVPATQPDEELAISLMREQGVLVHPGHFYDFAMDGYLVVSLITPPVRFRQGIARVLEHFES
ncbi:MAG TPA: pyridoxal phosphate-dependent aminotransferase [Terriglobales bacterium]|nr:pyridoxal phosphate-dependent aminotransferase [Terriglobales bacterium]